MATRVYVGRVYRKSKKELEELKEARFDDVCSVKECDEQGNVIPYNGEYEPEGR